MIVQVFIIVLTACGEVFGSTPLKSNQYLEEVLSHLSVVTLSGNFDPAFIVEGFSLTTEHLILGIPSYIEHIFYDGGLTGLLKMTREGDCSSPVLDNGKYVIQCNLSFNDIQFHYKVKLKTLVFPSKKITCTFEMGPTKALIEMAYDPILHNSSMSKLLLEEMGKITPTFTGVGPASQYLSDKMKEGYMSVLTSAFLTTFQYYLGPTLEHVVSRVSMSLP